MLLIESFDISDDHKKELLETVWNIAQNFVDRNFGHDSTQIVMEKIASDSSAESADSLYFQPSNNKNNVLPGGPKP